MNVHPNLTEITSDSIRYWEPRRILYNLVLLIIVIYQAIPVILKDRGIDWFEAFMGLFFLGILANVCYCFAYIPDLFVQFSEFRERWKRIRFIILILGIFVGGVLALELSASILSPYGTW